MGAVGRLRCLHPIIASNQIRVVSQRGRSGMA
jgi:hypothetical protein